MYTGYEWRGNADVAERSRREVYQVSEDGNRIEGRWFYEDHAEDGGEWSAVRDTGPSRVLAVLPQSVRAGTTAGVSVVGIGLGSGAASFGDGVSAGDIRRDPHVLHAQLKIAADAAPGLRAVQVGGASGRLAVYRQIDQVNVEPSYGIARLGGGRVEPVSAQFVALASTRLPDGQLLPLGPVDAAWTSTPFDAEAARTEDQKYSGYIDRRGRFLPGAAGPNPAREFSGDNVGNLTVVARSRTAAARSRGTAIWSSPCSAGTPRPSTEHHAHHHRTARMEFVEWPPGARGGRRLSSARADHRGVRCGCDGARGHRSLQDPGWSKRR